MYAPYWEVVAKLIFYIMNGAMGGDCAKFQTHAAFLQVESTSRSVSRAAFLSASVPRLSASFFQALISMEQLSAQGGSTTACRGND